MTDLIERYLPDRIKGFYNRKGKNKLICFEKKIKHYKQIIQ